MWILLSALMLSPTGTARDPVPEPARPGVEHVRAEQPAARRLIEAATAYSTIVRRLIDAIDQTDVIVYVQSSPPGEGRRRAFLSFLSAARGWRYLLVWVNSRLPPAEQIALLGHELQHAVEVAGAPSVVSPETMARHYSAVGWKTRHENTFETAAAKATGQAVMKELTERGPARARAWSVPRPPG